MFTRRTALLGAAVAALLATAPALAAEDLKLPLPPSAYFKRQIYATFQKDFHGVRAMAEIAPDNVMWGSDYPHRDGTWPFSQKAIDEQFRGIDESIKRKMLWDNVRRVYRIAS